MDLKSNEDFHHNRPKDPWNKALKDIGKIAKHNKTNKTNRDTYYDKTITRTAKSKSFYEVMSIRNEEDIMKGGVLRERRNLYWFDFENMKEFNNYCVQNNVSNVLKEIGTQVLLKSTKKKSKKSVKTK